MEKKSKKLWQTEQAAITIETRIHKKSGCFDCISKSCMFSCNFFLFVRYM
ncbi:hypothetical protein CLOSTMETH_01222 [[Clostridium] methylpentosum DSM 5476]|uniref:Uncharacterized protein n=1 Tax=[Clostridium] methylpentosum DSM 5476 TaxID=537013 RepID=C0EBK5_9FIRM|nr:hypothetical protein CLOSTMETH_01222 [[Clostridium] methylpentosum DSM 5476]